MVERSDTTDFYKDFPRPIRPDDEFYRAIHPNYLKGEKILPSGFANSSKPVQTDKMSVDWAEKSTPEETFGRWGTWGAGRGVAKITADLCRNNEQTIEYTPDDENPSHCNVRGKKPDRIRKNLARGAQLIIPHPNQASNDPFDDAQGRLSDSRQRG